MSPSPSREERWQRETAFFDAQAEATARAGIQPIDPAVLRRYSSATIETSLYPLEYAYALAGDVQDKRALDIGCGEGENSCLLGKLGANVRGIDISPGAVQVAAERAAANGLSSRVRFDVAALETISEYSETYDLIWCEAFLHHVLPDLEATLKHLIKALRPGGRLIVIEPISLSPTLRRLRQFVPLATNATPDERPLRQEELALVQRYVPASTTRYFRCLGRLERIVLPDGRYEYAPRVRKAAANLLARSDRKVLAGTRMRKYASVAVISGVAPGG